MLDLYYAPTPNGWKVTIMLEECGLAYRTIPIDFSRGDQYRDDYLRINPNAKMPALVDPDVEGEPLSIFESGAILQYLAEKTGRFLGRAPREKYAALQWVYWQVANLGPMGGQLKHFRMFNPENAYSLDRYRNEYDRLLGVLNYQLRRSAYLAGEEYSIADMATVPWVLSYRTFGFDLAANFPSVRRWLDDLKKRPALCRGIDVGKELRQLDVKPDEDTRNIMIGRTSDAYKDRRTD